MSKILIIEDCYECPFREDTKEWVYCSNSDKIIGTFEELNVIEGLYIPDWCKLDNEGWVK